MLRTPTKDSRLPADHQSDIEDLCRQIARMDHCVLPGETVTRLLRQRAENALLDWDAFRNSWSHLPLDSFMADGGRYRRRRHATLSASPSSSTFRIEAHQPHHQSLKYNALNGGVARHFAPIDGSVLRGNSMKSLVTLGCELFGRLSPYSAWYIELHQFRIEVNGSDVAKPTPEGTHRDGVSFVMMVMLNRTNVGEGTTTIYDLEGARLHEFTLTTPLEMAITNDERVLHGVTPIVQLDPDRPGHRDILVITFRYTA